LHGRGGLHVGEQHVTRQGAFAGAARTEHEKAS
jgi:hypothetical protein